MNMASGTKMSYNSYNAAKFDSFPQTSRRDVEVSQDMHLKMSKKIAQLTKVIYALNTKNDENEVVLQTLREQHEEEIQQILADSRQKVAVYKTRLDEEVGNSATIEMLQAKVAEYKLKHSSLQDEFTAYKVDIKLHQEREKQVFTAKLMDMSQEVTKAKESFEENLNQFTFWKEKISAEHLVVLEEMKQKHDLEMQGIQHSLRDQDGTWSEQCAQLEEKFNNQIAELKSNIEMLENDKIKLSDEYALASEKLKTFYENELDTLRKRQTQEHADMVEHMGKEMEKLKLDFGSSDREIKMQMDKLQHQLAIKENELRQSQQHLVTQQAQLAGKESNSNELSKELQRLELELDRKTSALKNIETELAGSKQHCTDLADELVKKSSKLGELEVCNNQMSENIASQKLELENLAVRLRQLDAEKTSLQLEQRHVSSEQRNVLQSLQEALEDMTIKKETLQQRLEKQEQSFKQQLQKQETGHKEELLKKLEEAEQKFTESQEKERKAATNVLLSTKQELKEHYESQMSQITEERDLVKQELEYLKADLTSKLAEAQNEVSRLEKLVKDSEEGLGSASSQLAGLKDAASQLRSELDKNRQELRASKTAASNLQAELEKLKVSHDSEVEQMKSLMSDRLQNLSQELDTKWIQTMKLESCKLREELAQQNESEKKAALAQLSQLKDEEIAATRAHLEANLEDLKNQIKELQARLANTKSEGDAERTKLRSEVESERSRLWKVIEDAANEHTRKVSSIEKVHAHEMEQLKILMEQEKIDLETSLKKVHMEELQAQITAHRAAIESATKLEQLQKQEALDKLKSQHQEEKGILRAQLEAKYQAEIDALKQAHRSEIQVARMELERAIEISKQKDKDQQMQLEEFHIEIGHKKQHIKNLQEQETKLQEEIFQLKQEVQSKMLEVKQAHKQSSQNLKIQEDRLIRQKQAEMDNLTADHLREKQNMLAQFSSAQDLLKDKISSLSIDLKEAHELYLRRDSRPEDLELIDALRCEVSERETRIKDLIDEKKFYQLELVNRETNFNKIFSTTPNVGVLNPFQKPKKKVDKPGKVSSAGPGSSTSSGSGNSHQRLEPLPGSPLHDGKLNPTKPLPQPNFVKKIL